MIMQAFTVYDSKSEAFARPFFVNTKGEAIRSFSEEVNNPQSMMGKYPEDFTLFHIGTYDDSNGVLVSLKTPLSVGLAIEFKRAPAQPPIPNLVDHHL